MNSTFISWVVGTKGPGETGIPAVLGMRVWRWGREWIVREAGEEMEGGEENQKE